MGCIARHFKLTIITTMKKIFIIAFLFIAAQVASAQQHVNVGATRIKVLSSDTTNSATTTFKWTPLSVAVDSNATWQIQAHLLTDSAGMFIGLHVPAGSTLSIDQSGFDTTASATHPVLWARIAADSTGGFAAPTSKNTWTDLNGTITTTSSTGNVIVMHKKGSVVARLHNGSWIKATKLK